MARRVSRSGIWISVTMPHWKRETRRASSLAISEAGRSEQRMIWRWDSKRSLKVWKNSSWIRSLPERK